MQFRNILILILVSPFIAAFSDKHGAPLIKQCVALGHSEEKCNCALLIQEEMLGPDFIEAIYLQATGDLKGYDKKVIEIAMADPNLSKTTAKAQKQAKKECGFRQ
jgi:hypothetical protein